MVGPYPDTESCVLDQTSRYDSADTARMVCSEIERRSVATEGFVLTESEISDIEATLGVTAGTAPAIAGGSNPPGSIESRLNEVSGALQAKYPNGFAGDQEYAPYPAATYDTYVIAVQNGEYKRLDYTITGDIVTFGDPVDVEQSWTPSTEGIAISDVIEVSAGASPDGREWNVTIIRPGPSLKGIDWTPQAIAEAAPMYERIPVGINDTEDHPEDRVRLGIPGGHTRSIVGWIDTVKVAADGALKGVLHLLDGAAPVKEMLVAALAAGTPRGLSHVVYVAPTTEAHVAGKSVRRVEKILRPRFVDIVRRPSAGGSLDVLTAATDPAITAAHKSTEGHNVPEPTLATTPTPEQLTEAMARIAAVEQRAARAEATSMLERKLGAIDLDPAAKDLVRSRFAAVERIFTESEVDAELGSVRAFLDKVGPTKAGGHARVQGGADAYDKVVDEMTESLFGVKTERDANGAISATKLLAPTIGQAPIRRDTSIRGWYDKLTGDTGMSGKTVGGLLTESITSATFDQAMADSITRAMQAAYTQNDLQTWRSWCSVVPAKDFRTNRRVRIGGYGNLPTVAQGAAYAALVSPTDEEATYALAKKGGTEDLTLEAVANDDLGVLRRIPQGLARAAGQTLHEFIYDFLATNANVSYEAVALAAAGHNNIGTAALSQSALIAARTRMRKQTDMSSTKRLGIRPRYLVVPIDLEQTAYELTATDKKPATAENDANFIKQFSLQTIVVEYWTDTNNWWLIADPADSPTLEVAFFNGQETPELFVQDQPTVGNNFTNDKLTFKERFIFGGAILDHRAFDGSIVA